MKSKWYLGLLAIFTMGMLTSCSGLQTTPCVTNCGGGGGTANVSLTLFDTPPSGALFLNFNLPIASMSLTPSGGGADVALLSTPTTYELTHLQSDSALVGTFSVASGTYTALNIFIINSPSSVWFNGSGSTVLGCTPVSICNLSGGAPGKISIDLTTAIGGTGLVLTANQNIGLGIDFNLNNLITTTNGISIDWTQPNVLSLIRLPRVGQATGTLDTLQNLTGIVTAINSGSITVKSSFQGTQTFLLDGNTTYNEVPNLPNQCSGGASFSCLAVNSTVSVDAVINTNTTLTATNVDIIRTAAVDEVEGTIFPTTTPGQLGMVVSDSIIVSGNTPAVPLNPGTTILLTPASSPLYVIDSKNFPTVNAGLFAGTGDLLSGQVVRAQIQSSSVSTLLNVVASTVILRFATITGTVGTTTPTSSVFYLDNLTLNPFYGNFVTQPQVQTYSPQTIIDGVANINSLTAGRSVSVSTLYVNGVPPFVATKVRQH
jgi:Domain of unknown function (DUF5666)